MPSAKGVHSCPSAAQTLTQTAAAAAVPLFVGNGLLLLTTPTVQAVWFCFLLQGWLQQNGAMISVTDPLSESPKSSVDALRVPWSTKTIIAYEQVYRNSYSILAGPGVWEQQEPSRDSKQQCQTTYSKGFSMALWTQNTTIFWQRTLISKDAT